MKSYIFTIIFSVLTFNTFGQFPRPQVSTQSPNAAGINVFGEVPVSIYTGIPQINIPLYTLEEGKISVPISLNYHAAGVRPNQHPGWVGVGWSLSAGGAITRKVKNVPDDIILSPTLGGLLTNSDYLKPANADSNYWQSTDYIRLLAKNNPSGFMDSEPDEFSFNFLGYSGNFYVDGATSSIKVRSEHPFKVQTEIGTANFICPPAKSISYKGSLTTRNCIDGSHPNFLKQFILTDVDGTQYFFGGDQSSIEFSINFFFQHTAIWIPNAWYLTKIVTVEGRSVTFNYDTGTTIQEEFPYLANISFSHFAEGYSTTGGQVPGKVYSVLFPNISRTCDSWENNNVPLIYGGELVRPVYLKDITVTTPGLTNTHKIKFGKSLTNELKYPDRAFEEFREHMLSPPNTGFVDSDMLPYLRSSSDGGGTNLAMYTNRLKWYKLDSLKVFNQRNELINEYNFNYNNISTERLFLNSINKKETGGSALQTYSFNYFDKSTLPGYLDEYDKTDHWGFLNEGDKPTGQSTVKVKQFVVNWNSASLFPRKQPTQDANLAKKGTLSSITYPTGGTTSFDYEPNTYSNVVSPDRNTFLAGTNIGTTGGIRVKSITSCESVNNCLKKEYYYVSGYTAGSNPATLPSSGILAGMPQYGWSYNYNYEASNGTTNQPIQSMAFSCSSVLPGSENSYGSHIGYSEVVEKQIGTSPGNGYTIHKFTNFGTESGQHMDEKAPTASRYNLPGNRSIYEPFIDKSYERGKLTSQQIFNKDGALVSSRNIEYSVVNPNSVIRAIKVSKMQLCGTQDFVNSGTAYKIHRSLYLPTKETIVQYGTDGLSANGSVTTETNYEYNKLGFEKIKKVKQSDGTELITKKVYVGDLAINDTQIQSNASIYCHTNPRPAEYTSCYNLCIQGGGYPAGCELSCGTQCINNYINTRFTKANTVDLRQMYNSYMLAPVIEQQTWKFDANVSPNPYKLLSGGINFYKKYATGFQVNQSKTLPQLPDISDVDESDRNYTDFPFSNVDSDYNFNYYGKYSAFTPVVKFDDTYGYDSKGNIVEFKGRDGVITTYVWGYQHMYPVATIVGATYQEVTAALTYAPNENTAFQAKVRKEDVLPVLQTLRTNLNISKPMAQVTTRTYLSGVGINTETSPSGLITTYEYDKFNRLETVFDNDGKVLKSYKYNYKN